MTNQFKHRLLNEMLRSRIVDRAIVRVSWPDRTLVASQLFRVLLRFITVEKVIQLYMDVWASEEAAT